MHAVLREHTHTDSQTHRLWHENNSNSGMKTNNSKESKRINFYNLSFILNVSQYCVKPETFYSKPECHTQ